MYWGKYILTRNRKKVICKDSIDKSSIFRLKELGVFLFFNMKQTITDNGKDSANIRICPLINKRWNI